MLFSSPLYGAFLLGTWCIFWVLRDQRTARALFLVLASYAFYFYGTFDAAKDEPVPLSPAWWAVMCLGVIFVGSTIDFFVGRALGRVTGRGARNALLLVSVVYYLGVLAVFKYWNFAADSIASLGAAVGVHVTPTRLRLVLPFGISFFTFETMSYTIDVWRREIEPDGTSPAQQGRHQATNYLDYLLFVCFFPHLVAGPIVRPHQMLPQLAAPPRADAAMQARGLFRIATGLAKKLVIGDYLAQALVNRVFEAPERFTSLEALLAVYGYAAQIYADFSGYSDVAIGSAALFGYELPENFDAPYASRDLQEFWRRWHISLSSWLRDYLYKPLGGSRRGAGATYRNLMITMVLGGLWHGASWNFVLWGALHGGALALTRVWQRARAKASSARRMTTLSTLLAPLLTFHFVCFAWVFFRARTFEHATLLLRQGARMTGGLEHVAPKAVLVIAVAMLLHFIPRGPEERLREGFARAPAVAQGLLLAGAAMALHLAAGIAPEPFVYGQF
jgi:D-alanyl-lipoteichoic acid acyltransferase DltB (MBOAT superfamily)